MAAENEATIEECMRTLEAFSVNDEFMDKHVTMQRRAAYARHSTEQWLDENEREWYMLDALCRSRPWAKNKDQRFTYPFRKTTQDMRDAGDVGWVGDDKPMPRDTRMEAPSDVIVHVRPVPEFPPAMRVLLFTPEFGSELSYDVVDGWYKLYPQEDYDLWAICWQGWSNFGDMLQQVRRKVLSFADGVSTVWFGHSMGAIVAYEVLKLVQQVPTPNLPVALVVSGCPAPHLFSEQYKPWEVCPWLKAPRPGDFGTLERSQVETLQRDFSMQIDPKVDKISGRVLHGNRSMASQIGVQHMPTAAQQDAIFNDIKVMRDYEFNPEEDQKIMVPLCAICSDEDMLVDPEHVAEWAEYSQSDFDFLTLGEFDRGEESQGHGFAKLPPRALLRKIQEMSTKFRINKDINSKGMLADIGPVDGPLPETADCVIIGAGIAGVVMAKAFKEQGHEVLVLDRYHAIGGIWKYYANIYSRVNTSEVGYRINYEHGPGDRPNEDHTPTHDIMRDIHTIASKYAYGRFRCGWDVVKSEKTDDGGHLLTCKNVSDGRVQKIKCRSATFCVNRRIGKRRNVTFTDESRFRGDIVYGYANELTGLNFWGKKVIVVGAGAFAYENLRTSIEHGAKHATILGRRSGTTCPKWIDVIAFMRGVDKYYQTHKGGNIISFQAWQNCFLHAGIDTPDCWAEGLLKPHNHTISVSDLAFIGGYHGMVSLKVGEIASFRPDGHGVFFKDGSSVDCDIVIKATGFHLNDEMPKITGHAKMHGAGMMDFNLSYQAESLLDGGQFGGAKGKIDSSEMISSDTDKFIAEHQHMLKDLPDKFQDMFVPKANPFGSGYVGVLKAQADYAAWLCKNEEEQQLLLKYYGTPKQDAVSFWASQGGLAPYEAMKEVVKTWIIARKGLEKLRGGTHRIPVEDSFGGEGIRTPVDA